MNVRFWDDLTEGERLDCRSITFTLQEIMEFARKYDPQTFHIDEQAAAASRFGGIIASSLQTLSACTRVIVDAQGDMAILSGLHIEQVQLPNPVRPDDVLSLQVYWTDLIRSRSKPDRGMATARFKAVNQNGAIVIESGFRYMIACRQNS
ncbi:MAG: MaoC/PaaZ C-terminal domain-containing protein [Desulfuromonadaceae bacterium]|nr:MaoC/PaaZ C-terminal domain-containing protein [Desulfuromonadaceae bacterium]